MGSMDTVFQEMRAARQAMEAACRAARISSDPARGEEALEAIHAAGLAAGRGREFLSRGRLERELAEGRLRAEMEAREWAFRLVDSTWATPAQVRAARATIQRGIDPSFQDLHTLEWAPPAHVLEELAELEEALR